jgi:putative PEP-CTERM system TPR-repeat lipoprotein
METMTSPANSSTPPGLGGKARWAYVLLAVVLILVVAFAAYRLHLAWSDQFPAEYVRQAQQYLARGDAQAAVIELKNALRKDPHATDARLLLAGIEIKKGEFATAEIQLRHARESDRADARVLPMLAKALQGQKKYQEILDEITPQPRSSGTEVAAIDVARGNAYLGNRWLEDAENQFLAADQADPGNAESSLGRVKLALAHGDTQAASKLLDQTLAKDNRNSEAWLIKGDLLRMARGVPAALDSYLKATTLDPIEPAAHKALAYAYIALGDYARAESEVDRLATLTPNSLAVHYTRALLAFKKHEINQAQSQLQIVLGAAPQHLPGLLLSGAVNYALGHYEEANEQLNKVLDKAPGNPYVRKLLAAAQIKLKQPGAALETLQPLLMENSTDPSLLTLVGLAELGNGNHAKANKDFNAAAAIDPKNPVYRNALAISHLDAGELALAMQDMESAASLEQDPLQAGSMKVLALFQRGEYDQALRLIGELDARIPNSPQLANFRGLALLAKKDELEARSSFESAIHLKPGFFPAVANLAQLDLHAGKPEDAKRRFQALLANDPKNHLAMRAMADLSLKQGDTNGYRAWLEKEADAAPDVMEPRARLIQYWLNRNQAAQALSYAQDTNLKRPDSVEAQGLLGQTQLRVGENSGALTTYQKLVNRAPKSAQFLLGLAISQGRVNEVDASRNSLQQVLKLDPKNVDALAAMALLELRAKNFSTATGFAMQLRDLTPGQPQGYELQADILMAQGQFAQAAPPYKTAYEMNRNGSLVVKQYAALNGSGRNAEGEAVIQEWLKQNPKDFSVHLYLADARMQSHNYPGAIEQYELAKQQAPTNTLVLNNLAWLYQQVHDKRALSTIQTALKLLPDDPSLVDTYAWILVDRGEAKLAAGLLLKAIAKVPNATNIHWHYAYALYKSGDKQLARQELKTLLMNGAPFPQKTEATNLLRKVSAELS